ncbi:MAG: hypothetical protein ACOY4T_08615 [Pseudomonadota bacterium]
MKPPGLPRFLPRGPYRRRRVADAARILPFVATLLFFLPILWAPGDTPEPDTASGAVYLFLAWTGVILAALVLSHRLGGQTDPAPRGDRDQDEAS